MKYYDDRIETMSRNEMEKLQLNRLQKMVDYCIERVPFYKEKLKEVGITSGSQIEKLSDISKLPFTTKHDLQNHYPDGFLAVPMNEVARIHASSGTTGKPKIGYYTKRDLDTWANTSARVLFLNGLRKGDILQLSQSYGLFTGGLGNHYGAEKLGCTIVPASAGNTQKQLVMLHDMGVTALIATPSYATHLSEIISKSEYSRSEIKIRKIIFGAERCTKSMRRTIEENLGAVTADNYGLTEFFGPGVAGECECQEGLHISEDLFYPEIIDPRTGEILPDGVQGELVFTSLYREAMPLLRYRTGDITTLTHERCRCGRTSVRMQAPYARTDDMFVFKGVNVYPTQIEYVIDGIEGLSPHYHIRLERKNHQDYATLFVELTKSRKTTGEEEVEKIKEILEKRLRDTVIVRMEIEMREPETLERFIGKAKRVEDLRYQAEEE